MPELKKVGGCYLSSDLALRTISWRDVMVASKRLAQMHRMDAAGQYA